MTKPKTPASAAPSADAAKEAAAKEAVETSADEETAPEVTAPEATETFDTAADEAEESEPASDPESIEVQGITFHRTHVGLPNTCTATGVKCKEFWYAQNRDAARAGTGYSLEYLRSQVKEKAPKAASPKASD